MKQSDMVVLGVGAVALYFLWKKLGGTVDAVTQNVANAWVDITGPPSVQSLLQGNVIFPGGQVMTTGDVSQYRTGNNRYTINGAVYQLTTRDGNGNYPAVRIQ